MDYKDYYKALGVERDATAEEIKRAYRKLVRKHHPDVNTGPDAAGAEQKFKEVGEAYEVLHDPEKRAAYDQLGANWQEGQAFRPPPDWDDGFEFSGGGYTQADPDQFGDFFEDLFARGADRGARPGAHMHAPGQDHHAKIVIDLSEAFKGGSRDFTLRKPELNAEGHIVLRDRAIRVTIPKGVTDGQHIRLKGQGAPGIGQGKPGDLYLEVAVRAAAGFRIEGRDVYMDLPVTPWEAALGCRISVETPSGKVELQVPDHAQPGKKLRLKGRGIPGKPAGDLYAVIKIVIPPTETQKARQLYEDLAREMDYEPRQKSGG
jgi:curved DNA-binding protein